MKRILCYGDSNTWGQIPGIGGRYDENTRWTGRLQKLLGPDYRVIEAGISGRTTSFDDPTCDYRNGRKGLGYALFEAAPIELLIVSLGGNDLKFTDAAGSARGLKALLRGVTHIYNLAMDDMVGKTARPEVLVISPISFLPEIDERMPRSSLYGRYEESKHFAEHYRPLCQAIGAHFMDAAEIVGADDADCLHMSLNSHEKLGDAVYSKVKEILG